MQNRFLLALILSMVLIMTWSAMNPPPPQPDEGETKPAVEDVRQPGPDAPGVGDPGPTVEPTKPAADEQLPEAAPFTGSLPIQNDSLRVDFAQPRRCGRAPGSAGWRATPAAATPGR